MAEKKIQVPFTDSAILSDLAGKLITDYNFQQLNDLSLSLVNKTAKLQKHDREAVLSYLESWTTEYTNVLNDKQNRINKLILFFAKSNYPYYTIEQFFMGTKNYNGNLIPPVAPIVIKVLSESKKKSWNKVSQRLKELEERIAYYYITSEATNDTVRNDGDLIDTTEMDYKDKIKNQLMRDIDRRTRHTDTLRSQLQVRIDFHEIMQPVYKDKDIAKIVLYLNDQLKQIMKMQKLISAKLRDIRLVVQGANDNIMEELKQFNEMAEDTQ